MWEWHLGARSLDVGEGLAGGKVRRVDLSAGNGDDLRAVNKFSDVLAEDCHLGHGVLEAVNHQLVVGYQMRKQLASWLIDGSSHTDKGLPLAGSASITSELKVGLQTELALEGGLNLAIVGAVAWEEGALQESLLTQGQYTSRSHF